MRSRWLPVVAGAVTLLGVSAVAQERPVYRCASEQGLVFSDVPCDSSFEPYRTTIPSFDASASAPAPPAAAPTQRAAPPRAATAKPVARHQQADACARIDTALARVRSRMRAGYTRGEGERLSERKTELAARRRALQCR